MCGICGFTMAQNQDLETLKNMCDTMIHRGPDGSGYFINNNIAFGHRRLSLVDLENGDQPIIRENNNKKCKVWHSDESNCFDAGNYAIVMNGEIYNYKEIRNDLEDYGYKFQTKSDTEVVLTGYIHWGNQVLNKLRGMFALAIWDGNKEEIFCARDFFGIKPFYYTNQNGQFIFASEIKAILEHKNYKKQLNVEALEQYLCFQFSALHETFFKDVYVLPQGHYLIVNKKGEIKTKQYWRPKFECNHKYNHEDLVNEINDKMHESVNYHNIADVEVGSLLSSGIDSSYNATILHKFNPKMKTFTVGFDAFKTKTEIKEEKNEIAWAKELADKIGMENYSKTISEEEYWAALPKIMWHMDEPNGDPSAVALYFVDQLAASKVKAVLSGEGADELFGGYTIYQTALPAAKLNWIPKPILSGASKIASKLNIRGSKYLERSSKGVENWYYTNAYTTAFNTEERVELLKNPNENMKMPTEITAKSYKQANKDSLDDCTKMQHTDLNFWILGDIFMKGDKMSMAHSLECRVPFLDTEVFETARKLPTNEKITNTQTKVALREAAKKVIPNDWANKKKLGFPVPMAQWLREDKYYNIIKKYFNNETSQQYFDTKYLMKIIDEHKNKTKDNSRKIWIIYMFLLWHEVFFENN